MTSILPIHPFPARMAPEVALAATQTLPPGSRVLDPLVGSGTTLRIAAEHGHTGLGFDLDPLAVLMAAVWTRPIEPDQIVAQTEQVIAQAAVLIPTEISLPWIDDDPATGAYIDFWFGPQQKADLRRLSFVLHSLHGPVADALRIALSRIIITKSGGASLAADTSHSRPHRVRTTNDYAVLPGFRRSAAEVARRLRQQPPPGGVTIAAGDARQLTSLPAGSVDAILTSPPYLNAIDYLRGHRLSLVWLGYTVDAVRQLRGRSVGAEHGPVQDANILQAQKLMAHLPELAALPQREQRIFTRYVTDMVALTAECGRVLRRGGQMTLVVGNSTVRGVFVQNDQVITAAAQQASLRLTHQVERDLPPTRRYLPPPTTEANPPNDLARRMHKELVLTYERV